MNIMVTVKLHIDDDAELKATVRTHIKELANEILKAECKQLFEALIKEKEESIKNMAKTYFQKGYSTYANIHNDWSDEIKAQVNAFILEPEIRQMMKELLIEKLKK